MECSGHLFLFSIKVMDLNNLSPHLPRFEFEFYFCCYKSGDKVDILEKWFSTSAVQ